MGVIEFIKKEYKLILILLFLFLINVFIFQNKMTALYIDFGKEIYLSKAIAQGGVLFKDVLAIFGPFAYLFNALVVKLSGAKLNTFYVVGSFNAFLIICAIYALSREFLSKLTSFAIAFFVLYYCCFVPHVMNFVTPYSYGMVYGLCATLYSALFFVKYLKSEKNVFLYSASFLCGLAAVNKYEFILPFLIIVLFLLLKNRDYLKVLKAFAFFLIMPVFCVALLFIQGLTLTEFLNYLDIWFKFANSSSMKNYYTGTFYFSVQYFVIALKSFVFSAVFLTVIYMMIKGIDIIAKNKKALSISLYVLAFTLFALSGYVYSKIFTYFVFCSAAMAVFVLAVFKIKEFNKNLPLFFVCIFSLAVGLKSFFFVQINQYGRYFLPLLVISLIILLKEYYFKNTKEIYIKTVVFFLLLLGTVSFAGNLNTLRYLNTKISTPYGTVYKDEASAKVFNTILDTVNKLTAPDDTVVVLQEGLLINFLSGRKADKYNYLIPSLLNLYGEDKVVNQYMSSSPEMFIILTSPNDKALICNGWGYKICGFINKNYRLVQTIKADNLILIFKKM